MFERPQILKNTDKFFGLADSALASIVRFLSGIAIARLGGAEMFATYILLITTNVIFLQIPNTCYLTPLLNRGTGAATKQIGALHEWAQRGVERAALVFLLLMGLASPLLPYIELSLTTLAAFSLASLAQLFALSERTHLQMRFKQSQALKATVLGSGAHLGLSALLWINNCELHSAFWFGAFLGASIATLIMRAQKAQTTADETTAALIERARRDGRAMLKGSLANSACSRTQPYLLASISSAQTLAHYGVIWSLIGPIRLLSMALTNLLRPRFALHHNTGNVDAFQRTSRIAFLILIAGGATATLTAAAIGPWAIGLLFGQELMPAGKWLAWGMLYATLDATTTCQMIALQVRKSDGPQISSKLRIHSAAISLISLVPLTVTLGLSGVFLSLIIAEAYYAFAAYRQAK